MLFLLLCYMNYHNFIEDKNEDKNEISYFEPVHSSLLLDIVKILLNSLITVRLL